MYKWIVIYALFCAVYLYFYQYKQHKTWVATLILVFCFPFLGFMINYLMHHHSKDKKNQMVEEILSIDDQKVGTTSLIKKDINEETNVIPIEDALILNENQVKRKMLLNLLKEESIQNVEVLKFALENDDTETSHYAATAIMEIKRKLLNSMQTIEVQVNENPNNLQTLAAYQEVIKQYLNSGFIDEKTYLKNMYTYSALLKKMIEIDCNNPRYFIEKISSDLTLAQYHEARQFCDQFLSVHPLVEDAYFLDMKIHYAMKDQNAFAKSISILRNSNVKLSPKGLSRLRFWLQGEWNE